MASMLLGTHPPRLPVRVLAAAASLFGISDGAARTALSRMVTAGEVTTDDGWYELGPGLVARQRRQDIGRQAERLAWDGTWRTLIVTADRRPAAERGATRGRLLDARFAELREGVWTRPANLADESIVDALTELDWIAGSTVFDRVPDAGELWPLADWQATAVGLGAAVRELTPSLVAGDRSALARGFVVAAAGLRHFRRDPLLPDELLPAGWLGTELRRDYDRFDTAYRAVLRAFFRESR
jgi:phenylacetic acid degradation operon negative regulatory protein